MRFGSVCSGIEAASVAWNPIGFEAAWLAEIEPFPCALLAHHYPDVPNLGDMTTIAARVAAGEVEAPDLFCGGTPCQAFSVAGLRNSLDDARGNLSLVFCEIADAVDAARSVLTKPPAIIFWENVPGVLNTKDNAFGCFLAGLAGEDDPITCPEGKWSTAGIVVGTKRTVAWRVLDAQYFGVAQRRRRVFVVASARAGFDPAEVLFEFDGLRRDTAPSREARKETADCTTGSTLIGGVDYENNAHGPDDVTGPLLKGSPTGGGRPLPAIAQCLTTRTGQRYDPETETILPAIAMINMQGSKGNSVAQADGPSYTLNAMHGHDMHAIAFPLDTQNCSPGHNSGGKGFGEHGDPSFTLTKGHSHAVAVNIYGGNKRPDRPEGGFYAKLDEATSKTLDAATGLNPTCSQGGTAAIQQMQVRRLTPRECERLQGFPDDYTLVPHRNKPAADGPRYKALGNSWAVPVVRWIGERIKGAL